MCRNVCKYVKRKIDRCGKVCRMKLSGLQKRVRGFCIKILVSGMDILLLNILYSVVLSYSKLASQV